MKTKWINLTLKCKGSALMHMHITSNMQVKWSCNMILAVSEHGWSFLLKRFMSTQSTAAFPQTPVVLQQTVCIRGEE